MDIVIEFRDGTYERFSEAEDIKANTCMRHVEVLYTGKERRYMIKGGEKPYIEEGKLLKNRKIINFDIIKSVTVMEEIK